MPELTWIGKEKVITHHLDVPFRVLDRKYSFDEAGRHVEDNGSENMIIHGDNLEALKALLPRFEGKIDCIYIDPPYNTGNEGWVYNDNVNDPRIKKWLGEVVGKEGDDLSRHDKWLCMMYPRLRLLQRLLSERGVIFISIDDHEQASLKFLCDEIFGRRNFITTFIWESTGNTDNQADITGIHEYIHVYGKNKGRSAINSVVDPNIPEDSKIRRNFVENSAVKNGSKNPPSIVELPIGFPCAVDSLSLPAHDFAKEFIDEALGLGYISREMSKRYPVNYPLRIDDMIIRNGELISPCKVFTGWMNAKKLSRFIEAGCIPVPEGDTDFRFFISKTGAIYYRKEGRKSHYVQSLLRNFGTTETNKYMLERMGLNFDYPKPVEFVSYLISLFCPKDGIVVDSFAGSGTTGHSVLELNHTDGGNRKFILVELGEYADSMTSTRIQHVIQGIGSGLNSLLATSDSFSYYELGEPLLRNGLINEMVGIDHVREYIWYTETKSPFTPESATNPYYLGAHQGTSYHLLYEPEASTVLNRAYIVSLPTEQLGDSSVIYADTCSLSAQELSALGVTFKKIPRDISRL